MDDLTLTRLRLYLGAIILGLLGMAFYLTAYHLWLDHKFVDLIREVNQQQQRPASAPPSSSERAK